jgi:hypothetical protein
MSKIKNKSTGADLLAPFLLQLSASLIAELLTHVFNLTIISGTFPRVWKASHVLHLRIRGDPSDLNNYRPISELSCEYIFFYSLINSQLRSFLATNCILSVYQSATNCILSVYQSATNCILSVYQFATNCIRSVYQSATNCILSVYQSATNCILSVYQSATNCILSVYKHSS